MNLLEKKIYYISFYSSFCNLSPFHHEWLALIQINDSEVVLLTKFDGMTYFVKSQSTVLKFCYLTKKKFRHHHFIGDFGKTVFFCQIIHGSPLNNNVPERRSVSWFYNWRCLFRDV